MPGTLRVAIFDDVLAARREVFHIPGLEVGVYGDADDVCLICSTGKPPDVVCMDYAMGPQHANGADAIRALRAVGFAGKILAMSSDPAANAAMISAGANESLLQKSMLRSFLVALGSGRLSGNHPAMPDRDVNDDAQDKGEKGVAALPLIMLVGALAAMILGVLMVGPLGHESRYQRDYVKLTARVLPQGSPASAIDRIPAAAEAVGVWAAKGKGKAFEMIAGEDRLGDARFQVAARGRRWSVDATRKTDWHLARGPSRRVNAPEDVPQGRGLPGFIDMRYVARSQRVVEGQNLWIVGFAHDDADGVPTLMASEIADEEHAGVLGPEVVGVPGVQAGGLALLGLSALLLVGASRS